MEVNNSSIALKSSKRSYLSRQYPRVSTDPKTEKVRDNFVEETSFGTLTVLIALVARSGDADPCFIISRVLGGILR